jgi:hypothetical protein
VQLITLRCVHCSTYQAHCCAADHTALCALQYISGTLLCRWSHSAVCIAVHIRHIVVQLVTLRCVHCSTYQAHCCAAGHISLCALQYISGTLQYISAMSKVLQIEVAGFDDVLLYGITFCHILIAAVCRHGHVIIYRTTIGCHLS